MTLQYIISGGQLHMDKLIFASELLLPDSPLKKLLRVEEFNGSKKPKITKMERTVTIDFNESSDIALDEEFYDLFKKLKIKYQGKVKGRIVIRISAITSYHVILDLNAEDDRVTYE